MSRMQTNAMLKPTDVSCQPTTVVANYFTDEQVREETQAAIEEIAPHRLAKIANCSVDAARSWIQGSRTPKAANIYNMARAIPRIAMILAERSGHKESEVIADLKKTAMQEGPEAAFARRILREHGIR